MSISISSSSSSCSSSSSSSSSRVEYLINNCLKGLQHIHVKFVFTCLIVSYFGKT